MDTMYSPACTPAWPGAAQQQHSMWPSTSTYTSASLFALSPTVTVPTGVSQGSSQESGRVGGYATAAQTHMVYGGQWQQQPSTWCGAGQSPGAGSQGSTCATVDLPVNQQAALLCPHGRPPGVVFSFGFGGHVVVLHPKMREEDAHAGGWGWVPACLCVPVLAAASAFLCLYIFVLYFTILYICISVFMPVFEVFASLSICLYVPCIICHSSVPSACTCFCDCACCACASE